MMRCFLLLVVASAALLSSQALHAELGSIAPVTLVLTVTGVTGALPDADLNGSADFEKTTATASSTTYEYKSKFVTAKITNASFINQLVASHVISDANYALVMLFNNEAYPLGFFLIRKGETPLVTQPINVNNYLSLNGLYDSSRAVSIKEVRQYDANYSLKSSSYGETFSEKSLMDLNIQNTWASGIFTLNAKLDAAKAQYVVLPSQILSIAGSGSSNDYYYSTVIEGRINLAASKAADISLFLN